MFPNAAEGAVSIEEFTSVFRRIRAIYTGITLIQTTGDFEQQVSW
jgi:hypothetical protein